MNSLYISFYLNKKLLGTANYDSDHQITDREDRYNVAKCMYITKYDRFVISSNEKVLIDSDVFSIYKKTKLFGFTLYKTNLIQKEIDLFNIKN